MRLFKENSVGLVIDIQERLFPLIYEHEQLAKNTGILIRGLKSIGIPLIFTQQYTKGLGESIQPVRELMDSEHIEKIAFSCCDDTGFSAALATLNKKYVIISGIETHVCVLQTAIDLIDLGYVPVIIEDCVSSRRLNDKQVAIARMKEEGAVISTYESILFELLKYSGTPEFKEISKLVK
jgi:nicotinamidase-related amidase